MKHSLNHRITSILCLVLVLCSLLAFPASAAESAAPAAVSPGAAVTPRYVNIVVLTASIDITSSGKANCYGYVQTSNSTHKNYLSISLQRYEDGYWKTIKTWNSSANSGYAEMDKSYYVVSGYCYRTAATATIYTSGGSYVEMATVYSQSYCY